MHMIMGEGGGGYCTSHSSNTKAYKFYASWRSRSLVGFHTIIKLWRPQSDLLEFIWDEEATYL